MICFSNTTPIIALSSIGRLNLLPLLFDTVHIVTEVIEECSVGGPIVVPNLHEQSWVSEIYSEQCVNNHVLLELDKGEKYTLDMALKKNADLVIIDEKIGRNVAEYLGLNVIGTLGILLKAKQMGAIDSFFDSVQSMTEQGIHYHPGLIKKLAIKAGE